MKYLQPLFPLAICLLVIFSCKKEPPTLGEQLEGDWLVRSYYGNQYELIDEKDSFTMSYKYYGNGKGETVWHWRTFIEREQDSIRGKYTVNTEENAISIEWNDGLFFFNQHRDKPFQILKFANDTLVLDEEASSVLHYKITAVRN
ncbi:MAG: hypothetical protein IPK76_07310 [Lewinellaceae bacterium]|jgi:hypothetical protein|nr:hypothetical protein [Lewinellaceae bacterium]